MENQNNNSSLKMLIIVLSVLFALSLVYIYKLTTDVNSTEQKLTTTLSEKEQVMKDLSDLKTTYDAAIAENTSMSDELIAERDKVVALMEKLKYSNGDVAKYKKQYLGLESKMKSLIAENETLKKDNTVLKVQRDSTIVVLDESKKTNKVLTGQNEDLSKTVEKGSKLAIVNLKTAAYIVRSSGKEIPTDKASRADVLKVSFTIAENAIAKSGERKYYVQLIDSKNNVMGERQTERFSDKTLTYSYIANVKFDNKTVDMVQNVPAEKLVKGTFYVNVFDNGQLVSTTTFTLK
jgi:regulator of replication initiation timing